MSEHETTAPAYLRLHHAAVTHPVGGEDRMREFYGGVLGLTEVQKPETMDRTKGCWFRHDGIELHTIPDPEFHPAGVGHPAILVDDLDALIARLEVAGVAVEPDDRFPGHRRLHAHDFFGNRLEFLQPLPAHEERRPR